MDYDDLFISILRTLSPEAINDILLKPIQAQCIFTQQPDYEDYDQFIPSENPTILQIRGDFLVQCDFKTRKVFGGIQLNLGYKFEIVRYAPLIQNGLGEPYAFQLHFPNSEDNEQQQVLIRLGVKPQNSSSLQKFGKCLGMKMIYQLNFHSVYSVLERMRNSNFVTIYTTKRLMDKKQFAVKCINKDLFMASGRNINEALQREFGIPIKLNHEYICKYFGLFLSQTSVYIVMESLFVNFLVFLNYSFQKSPQMLKQLFQKICIGVNVLHDNLIMHRDIKPQNVVLRKLRSNQYEPVIIDFGLAEYENSQNYLYKKCGTPGYAAPEIILEKTENPKYGKKCDIFSLGCLLHLILTRRPLFEGRTSTQVVDKNTKYEVDFTKELYQQLKEQERDLLLKMLEKEPKNRPTIKEVLVHQFFVPKVEGLKQGQSDIDSISSKTELNKI